MVRAMARPKDPQLRDRLIHAATEEFVERGYAGASMVGVGHRAGVTKGGVYFHFRSKEDLFFAALDHWHGALRQAMAGGAWANAMGAAALESFLGQYLQLHFDAPRGSRLLRVLSSELGAAFTAHLREDERQEQRWLRAQLRELLTRGSRDGELFAEDPAMAAFVLAGAVEGILAQWCAAAQDVEPFCDPRHLATVLVAPYRSRGPRRADDEDRFAPHG